ncbi:protein kinase domain-containing protein [Candidatus Leptofilum sp.]|uniref:protein kinase domain-containing protein n=1 Tax=Candidatus Leptofilum sp. TaxID=3241576 RepID=UPI003B5CD1CD
MMQLPKRYELGDKIGEGAMGEVYQAYDTKTERDVAIKILPSDSLKGPRRARFQREARTIARLEHPFVVPLYDFNLPVSQDEQPFLVMRYMTGGTLAKKIRQGRLSGDEVIQITRRIGQALDAAHKRNLVHRDIKPGNILLDDDGYAYLADFGIVKDSEAEEGLTKEGQPGTAPYMSPEQVMGNDLDGRSDIYALGVVVFEMLTGALPFGGNLGMIFQGHVNEPVPSVFKFVNDLPEEVDEILRKAMAKNPQDRFRKAEHLAHLLEAALQSPTAYMTSRDELIRTQEETFDTVTGSGDSGDAYRPDTAVSDTTPTPEVPATVETQPQRHWQWIAGGLGLVLVVVLALFIGSRLGQSTTPTPESRIAVIEPTEQPDATETPRPPTPIANVILVLQAHDSAVWENEGNLDKLPEDGRIPFRDSVLFQTGQDSIELLLPNFTRIILDANTRVRVETAVSENDAQVKLEQGRLLVKSELSVHVYHEEGYQADMVNGIIGVVYDPASESWEVDCLAGMCQLSEAEEAEPVDLSDGQSAQLAEDATLIPVNTQYSRIAAYNSLDASIILPTLTATATATATDTATPAPTSSSTPTHTPIPGFRGPETIVLGPSAGGRDIELVRFGDGPETLLLVGGIHSGYAPNSVVLAQQLIDYFEANISAVPNNVTLYIVPNLSPDAAVSPGTVAGRLNANGVDLNRNWDCRWDPDPKVLGQVVAGGGGSDVFSEPETQLLKDFIEENQPEAILFWGARRHENGSVAPGVCDDVSLVSATLAHYYAIPAGHEFIANPDVQANPDLPGDVSNWLDREGYPTIFVLLPGFLDVNFERELAGVQSLLTAVANPAKIQQTPTPESCPEPVNPAWATLYAAHRFQLGCPQSGVTRPLSVWQQFANGRMLWREDTDTVYVLYNDFTMNAFLVDQPGLAGFQVSELIKGAIGYVYDSNTAVAAKLGQPEDQERQAADVTLQQFSNGFIISWQDEGLQTNLIYLDANEWQNP